jgi:chloramphenicol O-acetyltransferase
MQTGAVSYHDSKKVVKTIVEKNRDIIRAVMKTKSEAFPDFEKDYREYMD